jgi:ABC-2 type transport system ATP-binding protein
VGTPRIPAASAETSASAPILTCSDLRRRFGTLVAVDGVSFQIQPGETYGLLGPNGAGKTTTISMIAGLLQSDGGQIEVAGKPMSPRSIGPKAAIGFVPQELAIYPDLTGRENLVFFARLYGMSGSEAKSRAGEVLDVVGLADRGNDLTKTYSGGMKRRLNIGIGLLHRPKLLILDEPTVGVDPQSRNAILGSVESLSASGVAVLYTTHYMEEAQRLCDRIGIMDHGKLIAEGTSRDLVSLVGESDRVDLAATGDLAGAVELLKGAPWVRKADATGEGIVVVVDGAREHLLAMLEMLTRAGAAVTSVSVSEPDLEAVFLHLTGRALRD